MTLLALCAVVAGALVTDADMTSGSGPASDPGDGDGRTGPPHGTSVEAPDGGERSRAAPAERPDADRDEADADAPTSEGTAADSEGTAAEVDAILADMSVEQQVGQLLMADVRGAHPTDVSPAAARDNRDRYGAATPAEVVERHQLGGVIYFTYSGAGHPPDPQRSNLLGPEQTAELSRGLQHAAAEGSGVGLLVATDQEHGLVTRTPPPFTRFPGAMALGATDDPGLAEQAARAGARELAAAGINVALAPVTDVNTEPANPVIGVRSPGADPDLVGRMAAAQVRGLTSGGVGAVAKHFPGHGSVATDSHAALPTVGTDADGLRRTALPPFEAAIAEDAGAVMPGHLAVPALDATGRPATVSPEMVGGLLRAELGFDGVVITDALDMDAITAQGDPVAVALAALEAGVDVLLMPPELPRVRAGLIAAVEEGRLPRVRLEASVRRVLEWKADLGLLDPDAAAPPGGAGEVVGDEAHGELARRVAGRAVTAVAAGCGLLPPAPEAHVAVAGPAAGGADGLGGRLDGSNLRVTATPTALEPTAAQIGAARGAAQAADLAVQVATAAWDHPGQQQLNAALAETPTPLVVVATAEPYDAAHLAADVHLAAYDRGPAALDAVTRTLLGGPAPGRLPVPVGGHHAGHGGALDACE